MSPKLSKTYIVVCWCYQAKRWHMAPLAEHQVHLTLSSFCLCIKRTLQHLHFIWPRVICTPVKHPSGGWHLSTMATVCFTVHKAHRNHILYIKGQPLKFGAKNSSKLLWFQKVLAYLESVNFGDSLKFCWSKFLIWSFNQAWDFSRF